MQDSTLSRLMEIELDLYNRLQAIDAERDSVLEDLGAIKRALELLRAKANIPEPSSPMDLTKLGKMTYLQAITAIANANGGRVQVRQAKHLLVQAGKATNLKTAYQQVTATILRSERFERIKPGEYRLLPEKAQSVQRPFIAIS